MDRKTTSEDDGLLEAIAEDERANLIAQFQEHDQAADTDFWRLLA